jgi:hypothetical protein
MAKRRTNSNSRWVLAELALDCEVYKKFIKKVRNNLDKYIIWWYILYKV